MKAIASEWVAKAEQDFAVAERESRVRKNPAYDAVCFHSQQCAEKYLKARMAEAGLSIPKTHDLALLLSQVASLEPGWALFRPALTFLSDFAVEFRYPGEPAEKTTATMAAKHCQQFRQAARLSLGLPCAPGKSRRRRAPRKRGG